MCFDRSVELHRFYRLSQSSYNLILTVKIFVQYTRSDVNFQSSNNSVHHDSAHWPVGLEMLRPTSSYLVCSEAMA